MTTLYEDIGTSYVTITEAGNGREDHFIIENTGNQDLHIQIGGGDAYHTLGPGNVMIRAGVNGAVQVKSPSDSFRGRLIVSGE